MHAETLAGWSPYALAAGADSPVLRWCRTEGERFDDPFLEESFIRVMRRPARLLFQHITPLALVDADDWREREVPLGGLVFHTSRCGSTLITRMLGATPSNLVLSEPWVVDSALRVTRRLGAGFDERVAALRLVVRAMLQRRDGETTSFVKLDCQHILEWPLFRAAFPDVPCVFLYRRPEEVLVSQVGRRASPMLPGIIPPELLGRSLEDLAAMGVEGYIGYVIGRLLSAGLDAHQRGELTLVHYDELPDVFATRLAPWWGLDADREARARWDNAARWNAKSPGQAWAGDRAAKQAAVTDTVRASAERWAGEAYRALEARRASISR